MTLFTPKSRRLVLAALLGMTAAHPGAVSAADTEIYLGAQAIRPGVQPNVLFIFDTSSSMRALDSFGTSRMARLKDAVNTVLDTLNNINAGIMRFTDPGGPVLFPVADIEGSASTFEGEGQPDVTARMLESADDAEELAGAMTLDSPVLELPDTPISSGETTIGPIEVTVSSDDAEQSSSLSPTATFTTKPIMAAVDDGVGSGVRFFGWRFLNLGIPAGSVVSEAHMDIYSLSELDGEVSFLLRAEEAASPATFSGSSGPLHRLIFNRTSTSVAWAPNILAAGEFHRTPDISSVVQEVIDDAAGWSSTSDLVMLLNGSSAFGDAARHRDFATFDTPPTGTARAARFTASYGTGPGGTQKVGLRFRDVRVPQGVRVIKAVIEFRAVSQSSVARRVNIRGEKTASAAAFTTTTNDISGRTLTSDDVQWDMEAWNNVDDPQITPDLADIVEEIVGQSSWCGGNDMAFVIEDNSGAGVRKAFSFDGDPSRAPVLRIDYDEGSPLGPGEGCTVLEVQRQVSAALDDAMEINSTGSMLPTFTAGYMFPLYTLGMRFRDVQLPQGAEILDARLTFTALNTITGLPTNATITGQRSVDAAGFSTSLHDITARPDTVSVPWTGVPDMVAGLDYDSPNISTIIEEIIGQAFWEEGNDLVLTLGTSSGLRTTITFDRAPARAPRLYVKARVHVGDGDVAIISVRQRLKDVITEFTPANDTPLVDVLYEGALYFRGDPVDFGLTRGTLDPAQRRFNRISHPATYTGGVVEPDATVCTPEDPNALVCADQRIVPAGTETPTYISPITDTCQSNYIVLLTDGDATRNASASKIESLIGDSCTATSNPNELCGIELAEYLATTEQNPDVEDSNVKTYTIGYNTSGEAWLRAIAAAGQGNFYAADTAEALVEVLRDIVDEILSRSTSFATPSLSVNAFNRLFHRNEVYFSLFEPSEKVLWQGNVKKYQLCQSADDGCDVGEVLDFQEPPPGDLDENGKRAGLPAINDDQRISSDARSDWLPEGDEPDGAEVLIGGAGRVLAEDQSAATRRLFTYNGGSLPATLTVGSIHEINATNITSVAALGGTTDTSDPAFMSDTERQELIAWIRGVDVDDEDNDGNTTENRYLFADPLHSSPVAVTFGGTEAEPVIKVFVGTNDGTVRMLNSYTGEEEWAFIPPTLLRNQRTLRENPRAEHVYGMDGTPTLWVNDEDGDGIIEPTVDTNGDGESEFVRMFIGMRRGGAEVLAMDVTPAATLTDPVSDTITPKLMWILSGNLDGTIVTPLTYGRLGETWSRPRIATVRLGVDDGSGGFNDARRPVLVFGGGYDAGAQDGATGLNDEGVGNAIYFVDPEDGSRIAFVTSPADLAAHTDSGSGLGVSGMDYPIPSDVALLDSDGDGATDRLYVGDTGGQLWRVDIDADTANGGLDLTVGQLASVSTLGSKKNSRKFFYPPDVVQVRDRISHSTTGNYDLVTIVSGNRSHPLDLDVQNRFYAIYDETVGRMNDGTSPLTADGIADDYPIARDGSDTFTAGIPIAGPVDADSAAGVTASAGDLLRINDRLNFDPTTDEGAVNLAELSSRSGYHLDLGAPAIPGEDPPEDAGEKGLSSPIILAGKVFFTTYLPQAVVPGSGCALSEGSGQLYGLDVLTGAPAYNYDESSDPTNLTARDRTYRLGGGIPSAAVPIFQPEAITLLIGGGGGATTVNPDIQLPRDRTYWVQE